MQFHVGQLVRIVDTSPRYAHLLGEETTIRQFDPKDGMYELDLPSGCEHWPYCWAEPTSLRPVYDGHEPVSWADCIWQPRKVSA